MIKRILFFLTKEISGLHQAAYILGFFTLTSQLLGLVRDRLLAFMFGAGRTVDIYYAAFKIPDLVLVVAGSIVSISVLVPFLTGKLSKDHETAEKFIDAVFTVFFVAVVVICAGLFFALPTLVPMVFPGIEDPALQSDLVLLARIFLLSPIILGISNIFASIVQVYKRFLIYAISPLLYNLGIIIGIVLLYPLFGVTGLGLGVVVGVIMHAGIQIPFIIKKGFMPRWRILSDTSSVWKLVRTSLPRTFTLSTNKLAILFLISVASLLAPGSIAIFNFSFNLQSVPMAIVGASYSLAAFPSLSKLFHDSDIKGFMRQIQTAVRHVLFWSLPTLVLFIVLRAQIVRVILGTGEFGWVATRLTAAALALFAVSVAAQSLVLVFVRAFYAADDTKTPLLTNVIGGLLIIGGAYGFTALFQQANFFKFFIESLLRVEDVPGTAVLMLPLAYSVGSIINAGLLWYLFQRSFGAFDTSLIRSLGQSTAGAIVTGFVAYQGLVLFGGWLDLTTTVGVFLQGILAGFAGIAAGALTLWLLGNSEMEEIWRSVRKRYWHVSLGAAGGENQ